MIIYPSIVIMQCFKKSNRGRNQILKRSHRIKSCNRLALISLNMKLNVYKTFSCNVNWLIINVIYHIHGVLDSFGSRMISRHHCCIHMLQSCNRSVSYLTLYGRQSKDTIVDVDINNMETIIRVCGVASLQVPVGVGLQC